MAEASNIGANFSNYTGDPSLGGGTLGAVRIDTRPFEDLARYTMLYQREEYLQRQKEAEKAAEELAKFTQIDLSTTIPKDAKILQEGWEKVMEYARQNIGELTYSKNKEKWLEFSKLKSDLVNKTKFAAIRSLMNVKRQNDIAAETSDDVRNVLKKQLQDNINATDIMTPLDWAPKFDLSIPEFTKNAGIDVIPAKRAPNEIFRVKTKLFDVAEANRKGDAAEIGFSFDPNTTTGKLKMLKAKENVWVQAKDIFNSAVQSAKKEDGSIDEKKLAGLKIMGNVDAYNKYIAETKAEIAAGLYNDKLGNGIQFGKGSLRIEDYEPINWKDGVSAGELSKLYEYSQWAGDQREALDVIQTNELIERQRLAAEWERIGIARDQLNKSSTEDLISADSVIREVIDVIKTGEPKTIKKNGKLVSNIIQVADPNILKEFGTIDKDGNVTNVPDAFTYDPSSNQLSLIYFKMDDDRNIIKYSKGGDVIDREVKMTPTQWIGQITKRKNPNKDIGGVNSLVDQVYNKFGRDLIKLAEGYQGTTTGSTKKTETITLTPAQIEFKKKYGLQ